MVGYLIAFVDKDEEEIKSGHDGSCHVDVLLEGGEEKEGKRRGRRRKVEGEKVDKEGRRKKERREEKRAKG